MSNELLQLQQATLDKLNKDLSLLEKERDSAISAINDKYGEKINSLLEARNHINSAITSITGVSTSLVETTVRAKVLKRGEVIKDSRGLITGWNWAKPVNEDKFLISENTYKDIITEVFIGYGSATIMEAMDVVEFYNGLEVGTKEYNKVLANFKTNAYNLIKNETLKISENVDNKTKRYRLNK